MKPVDMTGQRFSQLVVLRRAPNGPGDKSRWLCRCDCGVEKEVPRATLVDGRSKSCGCAHATLFKVTHGMRKTPIYNVWCKMRRRCENPNDADYRHYGGRGISVCDRWKAFENFYADMGERPDGGSLERVDTNGNYEPQNCTWIPKRDQPRNTRRARYVLLRGEKMISADAARVLGVRANKISYWLKKPHKCPPFLQAVST